MDDALHALNCAMRRASNESDGGYFVSFKDGSLTLEVPDIPIQRLARCLEDEGWVFTKNEMPDTT